MQYEKNDRVKLNQDVTIESGTIAKGSVGTVTDVLITLKLYVVDFDNGQKGIKLLENRLEKA